MKRMATVNGQRAVIDMTELSFYWITEHSEIVRDSIGDIVDVVSLKDGAPAKSRTHELTPFDTVEIEYTDNGYTQDGLHEPL